MSIKNISDSKKKFIQNRLKERRLLLNMTYDDLANKTGIAKSTLQRYEKGKIVNISLDKIYILSQALEVSTDYFLKLTDDTYDESSINFKSEDYKLNFEEFLLYKDTLEQNALGKLSPKLIAQGYKVEKSNHGRMGNLIATKSNEIWHFSFLYYNDKKSSSNSQTLNTSQLLFKFGRIAIYEKPITKYSFITDNLTVADQILKFKPKHLNIPISIILLNEQGYEELFFDI